MVRIIILSWQDENKIDYNMKFAFHILDISSTTETIESNEVQISRLILGKGIARVNMHYSMYTII